MFGMNGSSSHLAKYVYVIYEEDLRVQTNGGVLGKSRHSGDFP